MSDTPRFSITVPAYNAALTLRETVASVRAQTCADWEMVIVDDGSTDDTHALARALSAEDSRIRMLSQANRGSGGAYNTAVRTTRSDLLVMLSADDLLLPDHLQAFDAFIGGQRDAAIFTCTGYYEYEDGSREPARPTEGWADPAGCTLEELLAGSLFGVGAVYRREVFDAVGGFREDTYAEDYAFWLSAMAHGFTHRHLDRPLSVHRRITSQKSSNAIAMRESDVRVIADLIATGRLSPAQLEAAERSLSRLRRNICVRKAGTALLGSGLTERLIARARKRGSR